MSESTGILWNNHMDDISSPRRSNSYGYPASPANYIRPGKRPISLMSPLVIYNAKNDKELLSIGAEVGSKIICAVAGTVFHTLWLNRDVKQALDFPRLHNQLKPNFTEYELNWPKSMQKELYRHSVESERIMKGQPIRLRKRKYREAEVKFAQIRQEYRAVVDGNVFLAADVEEDEIQAVLIPFARKMAYCCPTFVDAETLLEISANEDGIQPDAEVADEREEISELSAFLANDE